MTRAGELFGKTPQEIQYDKEDKNACAMAEAEAGKQRFAANETLRALVTYEKKKGRALVTKEVEGIYRKLRLLTGRRVRDTKGNVRNCFTATLLTHTPFWKGRSKEQFLPLTNDAAADLTWLKEVAAAPDGKEQKDQLVQLMMLSEERTDAVLILYYHASFLINQFRIAAAKLYMEAKQKGPILLRKLRKGKPVEERMVIGKKLTEAARDLVRAHGACEAYMGNGLFQQTAVEAKNKLLQLLGEGEKFFDKIARELLDEGRGALERLLMNANELSPEWEDVDPTDEENLDPEYIENTLLNNPNLAAIPEMLKHVREGKAQMRELFSTTGMKEPESLTTAVEEVVGHAQTTLCVAAVAQVLYGPGKGASDADKATMKRSCYDYFTKIGRAPPQAWVKALTNA